MLGPIVSALALAIAVADRDGFVTDPREVEFAFEDEARLWPYQRRAGKAFRTRGVPRDGAAVPLVVIAQGIIWDGRPHHWLTEDPTGPWDARPVLDDLVARGAIPPLVAAVASQTRDGHDPTALRDLDLDAFVDALDQALSPAQRVDRRRIVVLGHSAAACDGVHGAYATLRAKTRPRALLLVDGCLATQGAISAATSDGADEIVYSFQDRVWLERPFAQFRSTFERNARPGHLLEKIDLDSVNAHLEIVEAVLRRHLPRILGAGGS